MNAQNEKTIPRIEATGQADVIRSAAAGAPDRFNLWAAVVKGLGAAHAAEIGVWKGQFAERLLRECPSLRRYYLIDPWRHLDDWDKPLNVSNDAFAPVKAEALSRTEFAAERRVVLQGRTTEVADKIPDASLDFAYIDGDHTARGILIDLVRIWPKVKPGGVLGGDDFHASAWQHDQRFEPTLIFPLAVYFAEAVGARIYGLPFNQFAILAAPKISFAFEDLTGSYRSLAIRDAIAAAPTEPWIRRAYRRAKRLLGR